MASDGKIEAIVVRKRYAGFDSKGKRHTFIAGEEDNDRVMVTPTQLRNAQGVLKTVAQVKAERDMQAELEKANAVAEKASARAAVAEEKANAGKG